MGRCSVTRYSAMRLTGYYLNPCEPCHNILKQTMAYLYHHPHIPIMFARKETIEKPLTLFVNKGEAELVPRPKAHSPVAFSDGDLGQDIALQRRSTTSTIHTYNGTIFDWICSKQNMTADCTKGS